MLRVLLIALCGLVACHAPSASGPNDLVGAMAPDDLGGSATAPDDLARPPRTPGLGATPGPDGTTFQVWAPHADRVFVSGEWNGFATDADELTKGAGGVFAGRVAAARAGQRYLYVIRHGADVVTRHDPRARRITGFDGQSVIVDPDAYVWRSPAYTPPPVEEQVVYELHLGTFNVRAGESWGSFASAIEKLDHLRDLGVTTIELMPPAETPGERSWGYNPQFPFSVENVYGGVEEMRRFVDEAHARGMGVVVDVVYNHLTNYQQPLKCFDGDCLGKNGIYFYADDARATTPWGPRPDFGRPEVRRWVIDNAAYFLDELRCDGMRWDSTVNIRAYGDGATAIPEGWALLGEATDELHRRWPRSLQIAEDLKDDARLTRKTSDGGAGFDAQWDPAFFHPVNDTIIAANDADRGMWKIRDAIAHQHDGSGLRRVVYTESHDEVANGRKRIPEMIAPNDPGGWAARKRSTLGAAITLTSPGVPMLFMGMEFLERGSFADQKPLDWSKATTYAPVLALYRDLVALRRNVGGKTRGLTGNNVNVFHVNDGAKVIAYHRWKSGGVGDDVVVIANFSGRAFSAYELGLPRAGTWRVRLNGDDKKYGADYAGTATADVTATAGTYDGFAQKGTFAIGPYSVVVLSQE